MIIRPKKCQPSWKPTLETNSIFWQSLPFLFSFFFFRDKESNNGEWLRDWIFSVKGTSQWSWLMDEDVPLMDSYCMAGLTIMLSQILKTVSINGVAPFWNYWKQMHLKTICSSTRRYCNDFDLILLWQTLNTFRYRYIFFEGNNSHWLESSDG